MTHYETRLREIIASSPDPIAATARAEEAGHAARMRDCGLPVPLPRDPGCDPDHFHPMTWVARTLFDCRKRCKSRGLDFALTAAWVLSRLERQHYRCAVSGVEFSARRPRDSHKRPWMPSLDRIDCTRGYTKDNVRIVCVAVNTLLQDWGDSVFHELMAARK